MSGQSRWQQRWEQASRDFEELEQQMAEGEIPASTGRRLQKTYREEMEEAKTTVPAGNLPPGSGPDLRRKRAFGVPFLEPGKGHGGGDTGRGGGGAGVFGGMVRRR